MKADLYVQGNFWATIDIQPDGLLALLAQGIITEATKKATQLQSDLNSIDGVNCSVSLRWPMPVAAPTEQPEP